MSLYLGGWARGAEHAAIRLLVRAAVVPPLDEPPEEGVDRVQIYPPLCVRDSARTVRVPD